MKSLWMLIPVVVIVVAVMAVCINPEQGAARDYSQTTTESSGTFVDRLDWDGDGKVSAGEFDGPAEHFTHMDVNKDGYLSDDEAPRPRNGGTDQEVGRRPEDGSGQGMGRGMGQGSDQRMGQGRQGRMAGGTPMAHLDKDGDNQVSREEFPGPEEHFMRFDTNGDGYLSSDELPKGPPPRRGQKQ